MFSQLIFKPVDTATFSKYPVVGARSARNVSNAAYWQILHESKAGYAQKVGFAKKYDLVRHPC
jgi:hypothetical protein